MKGLRAAAVVFAMASVGCARAHRGQAAESHVGAPAAPATSLDAASSLDAGASSPNVQLTAADSDTPSVSPGDAGAGPPAALRPTRLLLDFTTVLQNGRYAPHNGGVAWVADAQGRWVYTFELWISINDSGPLKAYKAAGGPPYFWMHPIIGFPQQMMQLPPDVISSATFNTPKAHAGDTWNLKDANGNEVADGNYVLVMEFTEGEPEQVYQFPFAKTGAPTAWMPPDQGAFKDVKLSLE
jgi:hypothetical protein